jgi:hypothetical protein
MRRVAWAFGALLATAIACTLQGGTKDACNTDADCNPGRVCQDGTCMAADGGIADASAEPSPTDAPASPFMIMTQGDAGAGRLNAIWGADANHVFAVGDGAVRYLIENGTPTRHGGESAGQDYTAVWGYAPNDVFAVGRFEANGQGFIDHYDGVEWKTVQTTPTALFGVWGGTGGPAPEFAFACGYNGALYFWYTGLAQWQDVGPLAANTFQGVPRSKYDPMLYGLTGQDLNDFVIAGGTDRIFVSNAVAGGFSTIDPAMYEDTVFHSVWQVPDASTTTLYLGGSYASLWQFEGPIYGDGGNHAPKLARMFDDETEGGSTRTILGLWGTHTSLVAVGDMAKIVLFTIGDQASVPIPSPTPPTTSLRGVWGSSLADVWIVGDGETILHGSLAP